MANGYDTHSLKATGLTEAASSSDTASQVAVRDKRFTRNGIGYRTQAQEATSLDPGKIGQTPPPIMYPDGSPTGVAVRKRGQVDEAKLPWQTAQEATSPQIRPRDTLPPWGNGMNEALPPWLKGKEEDDEGDSPKSKRGMKENDDWYGDDEECDSGFPDEEDARDALATLSQFVDGGTLKAIQNQIAKQYGDPADDSENAPAVAFEAQRDMSEAPLNAKKRNDLDSSDFALPGRKYPIDTPERARSALARVKQFGSPEDQKKVKAAVQKKYPNMKVD